MYLLNWEQTKPSIFSLVENLGTPKLGNMYNAGNSKIVGENILAPFSDREHHLYSVGEKSPNKIIATRQVVS